MEKTGKVDEASVLSRFPDTQDQAQIAGIFHTLDRAATGKDREKAIRETLVKVFAAADGDTPPDLNRAIRRKKLESELRKLKITL